MVSGSCLALLSPVVASAKLFFWLFQHRTERLQPLVASLLSTMAGYTFSAPVIKEREVRLDGLFLPPAEELHDKPALILEAQMAAEPEFLLRLYIETALLLRHQQHQGKPVRHWRMLVICPSRHLNFGDPLPVAEFLREQAAATPLASDLEDVIAAILLSRFNGRSITDICATGGITLDDFRTASPSRRSSCWAARKAGSRAARKVCRQASRKGSRLAGKLRPLPSRSACCSDALVLSIPAWRLRSRA